MDLAKCDCLILPIIPKRSHPIPAENWLNKGAVWTVLFPIFLGDCICFKLQRRAPFEFRSQSSACLFEPMVLYALFIPPFLYRSWLPYSADWTLPCTWCSSEQMEEKGFLLRFPAWTGIPNVDKHTHKNTLQLKLRWALKGIQLHS